MIVSFISSLSQPPKYPKTLWHGVITNHSWWFFELTLLVLLVLPTYFLESQAMLTPKATSSSISRWGHRNKLSGIITIEDMSCGTEKQLKWLEVCPFGLSPWANEFTQCQWHYPSLNKINRENCIVVVPFLFCICTKMYWYSIWFVFICPKM